MKRLLCVMLSLLAAVVAGWSATQFTLVTPAWVAEHADDANVRILDVRAAPQAYFTGHVPNAVNMADNTLRGPYQGVPVQYLPPDTLRDLLTRAGVRDGQTVVLYSDGADVLGATMVGYVLEKLGYPTIAVMDGGWSAYRAANLPVTQRYPAYQPGTLTMREDPSISADLAQVRAALGNPGIKFIDARPRDGYAGEVTTWQRNGHIPGAINIDWHALTDRDNPHQFKSVADMQALFDAQGVRKTDNIILYCGTSREASLEFLAMRHLLGYPNVRLYEGSWTEYSATDLPMETGAPR